MAGHVVESNAQRRSPVAWLATRFESARGAEAGNIPSMEGLRGFAVILVFFVHYVTQVSPWLAASPAFLRATASLGIIGNTGVDLFFVLSGYLIYGSVLSRSQPFLRFMRRRVQRIYPAFLAVFALYVVLSIAMPQENKIPPGVGPAALYLAQNLLLLPGIFRTEPIITVAWSLSYEMFYYLVTPLAVSAFGMRQRPALVRLAIVTVPAVAYALLSVAGLFSGLLVRLVMFVAGILLYEALNDLKWRAPGSVAPLGVLAAGLAATLIRLPGVAGSLLYVAVVFPAYFTLCLTCFRTPSDWLPQAFSWTPLRWLGNMSYSYYLIHGLTLKAAFTVAGTLLPVSSGGPWVFWVLLAPAFALTLLSAGLLYVVVERPFSLGSTANRATRTPATVA